MVEGLCLEADLKLLKVPVHYVWTYCCTYLLLDLSLRTTSGLCCTIALKDIKAEQGTASHVSINEKPEIESEIVRPRVLSDRRMLDRTLAPRRRSEPSPGSSETHYATRKLVGGPPEGC